jgi:hypothetical protein
MVETFTKALGVKKLFRLSFGLFASLFLLWTLFNASSFVPEGQELKFTLALLAYSAVGVYVFGRQDLRSKLKDVSLLKATPYVLLSALFSFFFFSFLLGLSDPLPATLLSALVGVPLYLQLVNGLVFAVVETSFWQGHLDNNIGILGSMMVAGLFHMFIWTGSLLSNFIGASLLFGVFSLVNFYAKNFFIRSGVSSKLSVALALVITIGFHAGYNFAKFKVMFGV